MHVIARRALTRLLSAQRHGNTRAVHPLLPDEDAPEDSPLTYEFREQLNVPATLYKARAVPCAPSRAVWASQRVVARVSRLEKNPRTKCIRAPCRLLTRPRALRASQAKGGNGRAHPGFQSKPLLLTLLEVDQSGRGADEVGTITLNLAEFANAGMGTPHERALLVSLKPGVNMGA